MTVPLRLEVMGGLRVTLGDEPVVGFVSRKVEALLCYLAVEARPQLRSTLAALLWGDLPDADAAANLRQALANLRRLLGDRLVITRQSVELRQGDSLWLDSAAFEASLAAARRDAGREQLRAAVALYRGDFLEGVALRAAPAFDEWATIRREWLRELALGALHELSQQGASDGDYASGIHDTLRLLTLDPWREEAHRQLMWLYVRSGQRSAALAQYQSCRRVLRHELGVDPTADTTALYERIKAAQGVSSQPVLAPATPIVGYAAEQEELTRRLADPACRLIVLTGLGGMGKTRLALHAAAAWGPRFLHGAHVTSLAAVRSASTLIAAIAGQTGCALRGAEDAQEQVLAYLEDKDMLLVLDNFEHLIEAGADLLAAIYCRAAGVKLLVTSRERLPLREQRCVELRGLETPPAASHEGIEAYSAVQLFLQCARTVAAPFALAEGDELAVAAICRLVDGLPLGIELAAAWLRVLSCAEIAREIERNLAFLSSAQRDVPERHRSLRAVFDHSWQLLAGEERRALRQLAVFRGGFTREAAEQVAGVSADTLGVLVDRSLLRQQRIGAGPLRFDMHDLVLQYAWEKLQQADELDAAHARHLGFCLQLAEMAEPELVGADQRDWFGRLERDHDNVRAALRWALERDRAESAARISGALWRFWCIHGHLGEGSYWLEQALAMFRLPAEGADPVSQAVRAKALHGAGVLMQVQGKYHEARAHHEESLALRRARDDKRGVASSLNSLGVLARDQGDDARAQSLFEQSLALKRATGDRRGTAVSLNNLAMLVNAQGDVTRAAALHEESLALCQELDDKEGVATSLGNLAALAVERRDGARAGALFAESLALRRELGDKEGIADCLEGLARVAGIGAGGRPTQDDARRVARMCGAAEGLREAIGATLPLIDCSRRQALTALVQPLLPPGAFAAAWAEGRAMALDEAIRYALGVATTPSS